MRLKLSIFLGKIISAFSERLSLGAGGTWPGEVALALDPNILKYFASRFTKGIVLVAGTNGKTTTSLMIKKVLESDNQRVVHNDSGANLLNGLVSACIKHASWNGSFEADYGVFEVDENALGGVMSNVKCSLGRTRDRQMSNEKQKLIIVFLNLFRDQLDRYGEVDVIAEKWTDALSSFWQAIRLSRRARPESDHGRILVKPGTARMTTNGLTLIANADDPLVAHLGLTASLRAEGEAISRDRHATLAMTRKQDTVFRVSYFGVDDPSKYLKNLEHATDSIFCLNCGARLEYDGIYFSHIGIWKCPKCGEKRPTPDVSDWKSPLPGLYNTYNTLAAVSVAKCLGYKDEAIEKALAGFTPAFGRQEEFEIDGKRVKLFLSKNPAGFNESLKTVLELGATELLLVLNDRIPDGRDVSWIWDVDFELLMHDEHLMKERDDHMIIVSGDRMYDLALRLKYVNLLQTSKLKLQTLLEPKLEIAVEKALEKTPHGKTLYVLATYSAMLEVRKILTGRKIL